MAAFRPGLSPPDGQDADAFGFGHVRVFATTPLFCNSSLDPQRTISARLRDYRQQSQLHPTQEGPWNYGCYMEISNLDTVEAFITKDGSEIRELLSHRNSVIRHQSLAEARVPVGGDHAGTLSCEDRGNLLHHARQGPDPHRG